MVLTWTPWGPTATAMSCWSRGSWPEEDVKSRSAASGQRADRQRRRRPKRARTPRQRHTAIGGAWPDAGEAETGGRRTGVGSPARKRKHRRRPRHRASSAQGQNQHSSGSAPGWIHQQLQRGGTAQAKAAAAAEPPPALRAREQGK